MGKPVVMWVEVDPWQVATANREETTTFIVLVKEKCPLKDNQEKKEGLMVWTVIVWIKA